MLLLLSTAACQPATDASTAAQTSAAVSEPAPEAPTTGPSAPQSAAKPTSAPTPAPTLAPTPAGSNVTHWQCDTILLDLHEEGATARIDFEGRSLTLQHGESLVGARYADKQGNAFTRDGDKGTLALAGGESHACTPSTSKSPWNDAAARGVAFRAVGNEPGWWVEISGGAQPSLHAMLDYGDRMLDVATLHSESGSYAGQTSDGVTVRLVAERTECHDGMSGAAFEATATLTAGKKIYRGCGAFLED